MADEQSATVHVIDDDRDMRESLEYLIQSVGIPAKRYASATEFLNEFNPSLSGCVVCDIKMPGMSGVELFERLRELGSRIPVILMTAFADVPLAVRSLKSGVADFIEKPFDCDLMLERIRQVLANDHGRRAHHDEWSEFARRMESLTDKERTTLRLILAGSPNKSMAIQLGISERTVEVRRSSIMKKLDVKSFAELIRQVTHFEILFRDQISTTIPRAATEQNCSDEK